MMQNPGAENMAANGPVASQQVARGIEYLDAYSKTLTADATEYWRYHRKRFAWTSHLLLDLGRNPGPDGRPARKILDIGPSFQTLLLGHLFPDARIDTLGFFDGRYSLGPGAVHIPFDLNDTFEREKWPELRGDRYDMIVMLEVIEHLYTSPSFIFRFMREMMQPHGVLVIQTPNAVSLRKRVRMLRGRHPYDLIRETRSDPGHFREYTRKEMIRLAEAAGLQVSKTYMLNYFNTTGFISKISAYLPDTLREGMTHVMRKDPQALPATS